MSHQGTLTYFCGKMGAGKLTESKKVSVERNAVLISLKMNGYLRFIRTKFTLLMTILSLLLN